MTIWNSVAIEEGPVSLLQRDAESGRIAHAYLFGGAAGRLPLDAAMAFSAALVCPRGGCGECDACARVAHHAHPDVELIEPAGMQLLVDQVRDAVRSASRRPVASERRVIVVEGADRMNPTSQNAFLKALEEPPPSTTIILLAPSPDALLETVRSRCREVTFRTPRPEEIASMLMAQGVPEDEATRCALLGGDVQRAATLAKDGDVRSLRAELVARVLQRIRDPGEALEHAEWLAGKTREMRDRVVSGQRLDEEAFAQWSAEPKRVVADRLRREQRRAEQDALEASIDDIASVLRDLVAFSAGPDARLLNEEASAAIERRVSELGPGAEARIIACLTELERARRRLRANANVLLTLESVFLALHRHLS